jgi:MFS family permease
VNDQRLWTRTFLIGIVVNLFMSSVFYLLMTTMAVYAAQRFAASDSQAGLASSAFVIGAVFARLVAGKFLDVVGRRRMLVLSMIVFTLAGLSYLPVDDLTLLIVVRLVHGVAFGAGNTALIASVQSIIPPARRAEGNGYFGTATTVATAGGPFLGVLLMESLGFDALFWAATAGGLVAMLAGLAYRVPERTLAPEERAQLRSFRPSTFIDRGALPYAAVMGVGGFAYSSVLSYLAVHASALHMPQAASVFFLLYALGALFARLFAGRIQDAYGDNVVVVPVFVAYTAGLALLTGLGFGCLLPSLQAILINKTSPARVGVATSTFFLLLDIGTGVGPVFLGLIVAASGFPAMYGASAGLVVVGGALYALVHGLRAGGRR